MRIRSAITHSALAVAEGTLIALLVVGLMAGTAFAGKGGSKPSGGSTGGGTLALVMLIDQNGDRAPNDGDRITFNVSTSATPKPYVGLRCYQGASFVLDGYVGYFPTYMYNQWFNLGGMYWDSTLDASCTARLFYFDSRGREKLLNSMTFTVKP